MGELINLSGQILDSQIPDPIARDKETAEAITNHEKATDPHPTAYFNQSTGDARYRQVLSEQTFTASIKNIGLSLGKIGMGGVADNQLVNRCGIEVQAADNSSGAYTAFSAVMRYNSNS